MTACGPNAAGTPSNVDPTAASFVTSPSPSTMDAAEAGAADPAPDSASERLGATASGRYFGYIRTITAIDGSGNEEWRVDVDIARFLTGDEAGAAALEDGVIEALDGLPNDFYIRNLDPTTQRFELSDGAAVRLLVPGGGPETEPSSVERLARLYDARQSRASSATQDEAWMREMPFWIVLESGVVTNVEMQYLP